MTNTNWFLSPQPKQDPELRILCFPYAGGSASTYMSWSKCLPENVELIAVQPPGRATRMFEPSFSNMDALIDELLKTITKMIARPYILFGHSLGSRVAFELMARCKKIGYRLPLHFIASGSRGPHIPTRKKTIYQLPDKEFIAALEELNGTPKEVLENDDLMSLCLPLLRADFELADTYTYSSDTVFDCPITVLGGQEDIEITNADLQSWGNFFSRSADVHILPGDHFFIESNKQFVIQRVNMIIQSTFAKLNLKN